MNEFLNKADELGVITPPVLDTAPSFTTELVDVDEQGDARFRISLVDVKDRLLVMPTVVDSLVKAGALVWLEDHGVLTMANGIWKLYPLGWVSAGQLVGDCLAYRVEEAERAERATDQGVYRAG